jgi:hypothetical protein
VNVGWNDGVRERQETTEMLRFAQHDRRGGTTRVDGARLVVKVFGRHGDGATPEADKRRGYKRRTFGGRGIQCEGIRGGCVQPTTEAEDREKSKNCKTNPSLAKPAWKTDGNKAKNEPIFGGGDG